MARPELLAVERVRTRQRAAAGQDAREGAGAGRGHVQDHQDGGGQVRGELGDDIAESLDSSGGRADDDDVASWHVRPLW